MARDRKPRKEATSDASSVDVVVVTDATTTTDAVTDAVDVSGAPETFDVSDAAVAAVDPRIAELESVLSQTTAALVQANTQLAEAEGRAAYLTEQVAAGALVEGRANAAEAEVARLTIELQTAQNAASEAYAAVSEARAAVEAAEAASRDAVAAADVKVAAAAAEADAKLVAGEAALGQAFADKIAKLQGSQLWQIIPKFGPNQGKMPRVYALGHTVEEALDAARRAGITDIANISVAASKVVL